VVFPLYPYLATFDFYLSFCVIILSAVSLANALARVTSLEAKLKTTSKALKEANEKCAKEVSAAKVSADKAVKEAEARTIKAKKALAKVSQRQAKREEDVVKRLDGILMFVHSKYSLAFVFYCFIPVCQHAFFLLVVFFVMRQNSLERSSSFAWKNTKDPLLDVVGVLESKWRNVRNILQRTRHVLPSLFVGLFPKKKKDMPVGNLRNLVEAFDTLEDPILQLKLSSVRRGVEGTISLTQSHGENVDWEKVSFTYSRSLEEMKKFFLEAKKYTPNLVSFILPTLTPSTTAPSSSAPAPMDPYPAEVV
jgi:hypothetical protein